LKKILICGILIFALGSLLIFAGRDLSVFSAYTPNEPVTAYGYLTAQTPTTITVADDYYPVSGTFVNTLSGWDYTSGCYVYDENKPRPVFIGWTSSFSANRALTVVHVALRVNGIVREAQRMGTICFNINQPYSIAGMDFVQVSEGDDIELVITADGAGDIITVNHFIFFAVKIGD
jgi:hypothetical protein